MEGLGYFLLHLYGSVFLSIAGIILWIIALIVGLKKMAGKVIFIIGLLCLLPVGLIRYQRIRAEKADWDELGPLLQAIDKKDCRRVGALLNDGYDVNEDYLYLYPSTPLTYAVSKGDLCTVRLLLEHGANANAQANNGGIPLNCAIFRGDTAILASLLDYGADISLEKGTVPPIQPIQYATGRIVADKTIIEVMLRRGADPDAASGREMTPLQGAVARNRAEVVRCLLEYNADPSFEGALNIPPLDIAKSMLERFKKGELVYLEGGQKNMEEIIELLIRYGAEK